MLNPNLKELNQQVTEAILEAEGLERSHAETEQVRAAWVQVSAIEERITQVTRPDEIEGEIARRGVVTAALKAQDWQRARDRANFYLSQGCSKPMADAFRRLRAEADKAIRTTIKRQNAQAEELASHPNPEESE